MPAANHDGHPCPKSQESRSTHPHHTMENLPESDTPPFEPLLRQHEQRIAIGSSRNPSAVANIIALHFAWDVKEQLSAVEALLPLPGARAAFANARAAVEGALDLAYLLCDAAEFPQRAALARVGRWGPVPLFGRRWRARPGPARCARRPVPILARRAGFAFPCSIASRFAGTAFAVASLTAKAALAGAGGPLRGLALARSPLRYAVPRGAVARPLRCAAASCTISIDFRPAGHSPCILPNHTGWGMLAAITRDYS